MPIRASRLLRRRRPAEESYLARIIVDERPSFFTTMRRHDGATRRSVKARSAALFRRRGSSVKAAERSTAFSLPTPTTPSTRSALVKRVLGVTLRVHVRVCAPIGGYARGEENTSGSARSLTQLERSALIYIYMYFFYLFLRVRSVSLRFSKIEFSSAPLPVPSLRSALACRGRQGRDSVVVSHHGEENARTIFPRTGAREILSTFPFFSLLVTPLDRTNVFPFP